MAYIAQPINSQIRLSPYSQRLLQYGTDDSRIYLSKATNSLLDPYVFGYRDQFVPDKAEFPQFKPIYTDRVNAIVDGLENSITFDGTTATVKIGSGQCIADTTLLIFPEETELDVDISMLNWSSEHVRIILSVNFHWLETLYEQPPRLRLLLIDPNDTLNYGPDSWDAYIDKLVISVFDINTKTNDIKNLNPSPSTNYVTRYVNIKNMPYEIGPCISFLRNFSIYTDNNYARRQIVWTKPCLDPEGLLENQVTLPITFFADEQAPIIGVRFNIKYDPNLIHFPQFDINETLYSFNKLVDVYVDRSDVDNSETGLIRIQVGQNAVNPVLLPSLELGKLRFYYTTNAPEGTAIDIVIDDLIATYSNATTSAVPFMERIPEVTKMVEHAPVLTYHFQPACIIFNNLNLEEDQYLTFEMNNVFQKLEITSDVIVDMQTKSYHYFNDELLLSYNSSQQLVLEALNNSITFTVPEIVNRFNTQKKLTFEKNTDPIYIDNRWSFSNPYYYWTPKAADTLHLTCNDTDIRHYILTDQDLNYLMNNENTWLIIPSTTDKFFELLYRFDISTSKSELHVRISDDYKDDYELTEATLSIHVGSAICSDIPKVLDYHPAEQFYDLNDIDLNENDIIKYKDTTTNLDSQLILTKDILTVIKQRVYGYKSSNLYINVTSDNKLRLSCNTYNSNFEYSKIEDYYIDRNEPTSAPCLWMQSHIISTRPKNDGATFVEDPNLNYATCWALGDLPTTTAGERDFYATISLDHFINKDVHVQCYNGDFLIQPMAVEHPEVTPNILKIWMPESFIMTENIQQLKVILVG